MNDTTSTSNQPADDAVAPAGRVPLAQESDSLQTNRRRAEKPPRLDPTRYGDWEKNGRCIDF